MPSSASRTAGQSAAEAGSSSALKTVIITICRQLAFVAIIFIVLSWKIPVVTVDAAVTAAENPKIKALLKEGDKLVVKGRQHYPEAIKKFTEVIDIDGLSSKGLYRRGELYAMMKKHDDALADLELLLQVEQFHPQGRAKRAAVLQSKGFLTRASQDHAVLVDIYTKGLGGKKPDAKKAEKHLKESKELQQLGHEMDQMNHHIAALPTHPKPTQERIYSLCVETLGKVVSKYVKDSIELRLKRAECAIGAKDPSVASDELKYIFARQPKNLNGILVSAKSFRALGATDKAKSEVKRCLAFDPEHPGCSAMHKLIKHYAKASDKVDNLWNQHRYGEVPAAVEHALSIDSNPPNFNDLLKKKCEAFVQLKKPEEAMKACNEAIEADHKDNPAIFSLYLRRADVHILNDNLEEATEDVKRANEVAKNNEEVREYFQKLERLKQMAARKDYYKILGVKKTANDKEIRSAYRQLAMKVHPDKLRQFDMTQEEREKKETEFRDINEAKEILLDDDKRRRYDNGEDVTKPEGQQQHQHHWQGFQPNFGGGGGGGFNFRFG